MRPWAIAAGCAALIVAVVACAESTPVRGPDGTLGWYAVSCRKSQRYCWQEAARVCPEGYDVADQSQRQGFYATQYSAGSTYHGDMLIKCKSMQAKAPQHAPATQAAAPSAEPEAEQPHDSTHDGDSGTSPPHRE
jgi:hypothetical protein